MANLTIDQSVVKRERSDLTPIPKHSLVVYKKLDGSGRQPYATLEPGEVFRPKLLDRRFDFVGLAVNLDTNQRLQFSRKLKNIDQIHYFTLHLTLHFGVADAALLADLLKSDPLRRLQEETGQVLGSVVAATSWDEVRAKSFNPNRLLDHLHADESDLGQTHLQYLQNFAGQLGLELRSIKLGRSIHREDLEVAIAEQEKAKERKLKDLEHEEVLRDKHREQRQAKLEQQHQLELDEGAYQRAALNDYHRSQQLQDSLADNTTEALKNVASNITSAGQLEEAARRLTAIVRGADTHGLGGRGVGTLGAGAPSMGLLPESVTRQHGGIGQMLTEVFEKLEQINCSVEERKNLLASILHLAGESLRGEEARQELMEGYQKEIAASVKGLRGRISVEQFHFLKTLSDPQWTVEYLG